MPAKSSTQGPAHKHDELIRQVVDSERFRGAAPTMRTLLLHSVGASGEAISEYAIATGSSRTRNKDFDPKLDSTVRVQVAPFYGPS
jgi:hypothetical protein